MNAEPHLAIVHECVDDLKHLLLPERNLAEARAQHEVAHLVERGALLAQDELEALLPEHVDELGIVLVLRVPF